MIDLYNEMNIHIQMIPVNTPDIWNTETETTLWIQGSCILQSYFGVVLLENESSSYEIPNC